MVPVNWFDDREQLVIDWSQLLGHSCQVKVHVWNAGLRTVVINDNKPVASRLSDVGDWLFFIDDPAVRKWRESIPQDVLEKVQQLPDNRAVAAELAVKSSATLDLLKCNPTLLWLLIDRGVLKLGNDGHVPLLTNTKQRKLLGKLGLAGTNQQVRILRKTAYSRLGKGDVNSLLSLLTNEAICKYLSHSPVITSHQITLLASNPWLAACRAKALVPALKDRQLKRCFDDTVRMADELAPVMRCNSPLQLMRLHDLLVDRLNSQRIRHTLIRDEDGRVIPLSKPSMLGNENVILLTTQQSILLEGIAMHHCIGSYLQQVVSGTYAVYRMEQPERLTIGVVILTDGSVRLDDVRGPRNAAPSEEALAVVQTWWSECLKSLKTA